MSFPTNSRSLSSRSSKKRHAKFPNGNNKFSIIMLTLLMIVIILYFCSMYNVLMTQHSKLSWTNSNKEQIVNKLRNANANNHHSGIEDASSKNRNTKKSTLVLSTKYGNIRISLRPDLSKESVEYIYTFIQSNHCDKCNFYRAENPGILQGILQNKNIPINTQFGPCPDTAKSIPNNCPAHDKDCGCHGPMMTKGMVAWAAGMPGGPDFFIDNYAEPVEWWGTQHTNFGEIIDQDSFKVMDYIFELPVYTESGLTFLKNVIHFDIRLE